MLCNFFRTACLFAILLPLSQSQTASPPLPVPVANGHYTSHFGDPERDDDNGQRSSLTIDDRNATVSWWKNIDNAEKVACQIITRTKLKKSNLGPAAEVIELNCKNAGEEADNLLYLRS